MSMFKKEEFLKRLENDLLEDEKLKCQFLRETSEAKAQKRKKFVRRLQLERREGGLDGVVFKAQEMANLQSHGISQEERLAMEMNLIRQEETRNEKLRQLLRENNHELKELESQLRAAYVNKALAAQIAENEVRRAREEMYEARSEEMIFNALGDVEDIEKKSAVLEKQRKEKYRRSLQDQIIEKERLKQEEYVAFMKEKRLFEDTVKKIKEEEEKEKTKKFSVKKKMKEEMEQFYIARELWKAREKIRNDTEDKKVEVIQMKEQLESERNKRKEIADKGKARMIQDMTQELLTKNRLREEELDLTEMIRENEIIEKEKKELEKEHKNYLARKHEARVEFQRQLTERKQNLMAEKALDAKFTEQMNLKVQEEDRIDKERNEHKRQLRLRDRKYNEEKIKHNIEMHAQNLMLEQMRVTFEERDGKKRDEMIQEERLRILKKHAPYLMGYFPKGCLKEGELEMLNLDRNAHLSQSSSETDRNPNLCLE